MNANFAKKIMEMTAVATAETLTLDRRKLNLIGRLATIEDEILIQQLEAILFPEKDWWDDLSAESQSDFLEGMNDLDNGRSETYESFTARMTQKFA